jgi:hypothetical protein
MFRSLNLNELIPSLRLIYSCYSPRPALIAIMQLLAKIAQAHPGFISIKLCHFRLRRDSESANPPIVVLLATPFHEALITTAVPVFPSDANGSTPSKSPNYTRYTADFPLSYYMTTLRSKATRVIIDFFGVKECEFYRCRLASYCVGNGFRTYTVICIA